MSTKLKWSPEMAQALLDLSNGAEKLSAGEIARVLSARFGLACSRNAVLSKLHRLSAPPSPKPPRAAKTVPPGYQSWRGMKDLCRRPKHSSWHRYGGRGITVCARWANSFETFLGDMGPKPSPQHFLARIDKDGNYEPGNLPMGNAGEDAESGEARRAVAVERSRAAAVEHRSQGGISRMDEHEGGL
jgi:hypothetical protein